MEFRALTIPDAFEVTAPQFPDSRGLFTAPFVLSSFAEHTGRGFTVRQTNVSVSRAGAFRGIHYADVPPSQAKYVTALSGSLIDFVIDLREGSPTFGTWDSVLLDTVDRRAVFLPEGLGHALFALEDDSTALYLCNEGFAPEREHGINPLDPDIALTLPDGIPPIISAKDAEAPLLASVVGTGTLPSYDDCIDLYRSVNG